MSTTKYKTFGELPEWATSRIRKFRPTDAETWIFEPVPALDHQSFIDVINQGEDGVDRVRKYLVALFGKFFPEEK